MNPDIGKHPTEFYGHPPWVDSDEAEEERENEHCPFTGTRCSKRRKSDNDVTIGTCSVGYKGRGVSEYKPHVICPKRFYTDEVFEPVKTLFVDEGEHFRVPEVALFGASIDFVAGKQDSSGEIIDFAGIEIQAIDTTGSVWEHKKAYENGEDMNEVDKNYGMNWKMSLPKTMMQQAFQKGQAFDEWGENIIFLIQDVSLDYLHRTVNTSRLEEAKKENPVHFYTYSFDYNYETEKYEWEIDQKLSADLEGVSQMMDSDENMAIPTKDDFKGDIKNKF